MKGTWEKEEQPKNKIKFQVIAQFFPPLHKLSETLFKAAIKGRVERYLQNKSCHTGKEWTMFEWYGERTERVKDVRVIGDIT